MDCDQVKELLDAYALGAAEKAEARGLEEHVADCVRCWEELNEAQRAAASLALTVPIEEAPASLGDRILAQAEREVRPGRPLAALWQALRRRWLAAATAALAIAGVAALAFAAVLQVELNGVQDENDQLERQVQDQRQLAAVLSAPDVEEVAVASMSAESEALAVYYWSKATEKGFVVCNNLPPLAEGQVYQAWFITDGEAISAGTFTSGNGIGQLPMDLSILERRPDALGISIEEAGGSEQPTGEMLLYSSLPRQ